MPGYTPTQKVSCTMPVAVCQTAPRRDNRRKPCRSCRVGAGCCRRRRASASVRPLLRCAGQARSAPDPPDTSAGSQTSLGCCLARVSGKRKRSCAASRCPRKRAPVFPAAFDERGQFFQLFAADGGLHIRHLEVVSKVAVDILVVISLWQLAVLPVVAVSAEVIRAAGAGAVAPPVPKAQRDAALKADCLCRPRRPRPWSYGAADRSCWCPMSPPSARKAALAGDGVFAAERVAVVLDQPEPVTLAKNADGGKVERIAQRVREQNRLGARAQRRI